MGQKVKVCQISSSCVTQSPHVFEDPARVYGKPGTLEQSQK